MTGKRPIYPKSRVGFQGRSPGATATFETLGLGAAEILSSAVSLGVFAYADKVAPNLVGGISKTLGKIIEPYFDTIEKGLGAFCRLQECKPDQTRSKQERAEVMAHNLLLFGVAFVPSLLVKIATRRGVNSIGGIHDKNPWWKVWALNDHDKAVIAWDEGVHLGSLVLLNTGAAKYTDQLIRGATPIIQKMLGTTEKKAHEIASMAMIWELPNMLGLAAGTGAIMHKHLWSAEAKSKIAAMARGGAANPQLGL